MKGFKRLGWNLARIIIAQIVSHDYIYLRNWLSIGTKLSDSINEIVNLFMKSIVWRLKLSCILYAGFSLLLRQLTHKKESRKKIISAFQCYHHFLSELPNTETNNSETWVPQSVVASRVNVTNTNYVTRLNPRRTEC